MHQVQANALEIRKRLRNPVNGRQSSELEVVSPHRVERDRLKREDTMRRLQREQDRMALFNTLLAVYKRTQRVDDDGINIPTVRSISRATCDHLGLTSLHVFSQRRNKNLCRARQIVMYLAREHTGLSLPQIGKALDGRDHTTILHGARKIEGLIAAGDVKLIEDVAAIRVRLGISASGSARLAED